MTQNQSTKQETALDWFIEKIGYQKNGEWYIGIREDVNIQHWVDQVRQMEKEQIEDAYWTGGQDPDSTEERCQQYYNETYGTDDNTRIDRRLRL
jgi:hypothetical protein